MELAHTFPDENDFHVLVLRLLAPMVKDPAPKGSQVLLPDMNVERGIHG
jgi:hypothetical protein